jgi:muconolactone delta-isomerase
MLFMIHIQVHPRTDATQEQRTEGRERENQAALDLIRSGTLRRMFRCAGSIAARPQDHHTGRAHGSRSLLDHDRR